MKILIELLLAGVIGLNYGAIQRPDYDDTPTPEFLNPSWMATIPDDLPLSEVTMPGTHNTMALYGGVYAECQTWSLASQLQAGIRYLDIRVRHVKGNLTLHHGVSYQRAHFGHVLEGVADFLREYPSETVLMRLREEFSETYDIYGAVVDYIHRYAHWDLLWHSRLVPTMAEARGKLIVLQEFAGPDLGMRYGSLDIADDWKVPTLLHVEDKWQSVYEHLEAAPTGNKAQIFLTYSSGAGVFAYPRAIAQRINPQLYDYLRAKTELNQRLGIICMDFPAAPLIQTIIGFQMKESWTDMNPSPDVERSPQKAVLISTAVVLNIIWWMVMIAAIGVGTVHLGHCPLQPYIPIYLIVLGVSSICSLTLTYAKSIWDDGFACILSHGCMAILHLFSFCWFIAGNFWVYSIYPPNYTPEGPRYCQKTAYQFAFIVTTVVWASLVLACCCGCSFSAMTCCTTIVARRRLIPNRNSSYGAISDEPPAGDV
ncbi:hypothetical protein D5F01_LYC19304 [Larimichthys crocea]|uniref:Phosphatidylinositol-specific phospholipase C X domain-containing protein n=1 Tax=Larimichthys crocea TaxID=215358 RepID=A0A6G0HRT7_LARCR|nr:hypothetical protein D5F01_LYC19304 [Larimichthys crocea]